MDVLPTDRTRIAVVLGLFGLTMLSLYGAYSEQSFPPFRVDSFQFGRWHWIRDSSIVTYCTYLASRPIPEDFPRRESSESALVYIAFVVPVLFMLLHPGLDSFGGSDSNFGLACGAWAVIHGIAFLLLRALPLPDRHQ